jgi:hypothetical protein
MIRKTIRKTFLKKFRKTFQKRVIEAYLHLAWPGLVPGCFYLLFEIAVDFLGIMGNYQPFG